jgi:hypothetical protein
MDGTPGYHYSDELIISKSQMLNARPFRGVGGVLKSVTISP